MRDWMLYLVIAGVLAFAVSSWWGVRKLKARHTRSAVWEETHSPGLGQQKVAVVMNPIIYAEVQDSLISILSEKQVSIPELGELVSAQREYLIASQGMQAMSNAGAEAQAGMKQLAESSPAAIVTLFCCAM